MFMNEVEMSNIDPIEGIGLSHHTNGFVIMQTQPI